MRYNPFRITPYLLKVQGKGSSGGEEEEPCCLALAERIISGYEGTNIYHHHNQGAVGLLVFFFVCLFLD